MKKTLLCLFLISCIFINGCYSYKDINTVVFTTAVIFDIDKDNNPVIYLEIFKPAKSASKSAEKPERVVLKGTGKTPYEALSNINLASSYKIDYTQNKAIIYTQRAAEYGMNNFFDIFRRNCHFVIKPYMAIYKGDVERLAKATFGDEQFAGLFLLDLINNIGTSSRTVKAAINDYLLRSNGASKSTVLTAIKISDDEPKESLVVDGGAVIKKGKLVTLLPKVDGEAYNFLIGQVASGSMEVVDPRKSGKNISLRIESSKTKTKVDYDGKKVHAKKTINTKVSIIETQDYTDLTDEEIKEIKKGAEANLISLCTNVFNKYKQQNLDIFRIADDVENKYGDDKVKNSSDLIKYTQIEIEPHVIIEGSGKVRNYKE